MNQQARPCAFQRAALTPVALADDSVMAEEGQAA